MTDTARILIPEHHRADRSFVDYNELDLDSEMTVGEMTTADLEMAFAKRIGGKLMQVYPQRRWSVTVDVTAGYAQICCPSLSVTKGYILHLARYHTTRDLLRKVVEAGGEVLERHGIGRGKNFNADAIEDLQRDLQGDAVTADSAPNKRIITT